MRILRRAVLWIGLLSLIPVGAHGVELPRKHPYQRMLRKFMATLKEKDFEHGVTALITACPSSQDIDYQYRACMMTLMQQPLIGHKRGTPAVNVPARRFVLSSIECPKAVMVPPVWPETLVAFVEWDYPGNLYRNNRALKLRAFVTASVNMMMLDAHLDVTPSLHRADWLGYPLVSFGASYPGFKDLLPPEVQKACLAGLRRRAEMIMALPVHGEEPNLDMTVPVGLWYVSQALQDPAFTKAAEAYAKRILTAPKYFHPAGYFVERGGCDLGFQGMSNWFAIWLALASDWDFAKDAVARTQRLRAYVSLPEPDGTWTRPTEFITRLGTPAWDDQWHWDGARNHAAAMVTDESAYLITMPSAEELTGAAARRSGEFAFQIHQNVRVREKGKLRFLKNEELKGHPWRFLRFPTWNFPATVNPGYEFYKKGAYAHHVALEKAKSPWLVSPFLRPGTFVRDFAQAFLVAREPTFSVILHTGPVGSQRPEDGLFQFKSPLGFGGGQLSAFWTPETGCILLGRRGGMNWDNAFDKVEDWRVWPIHAVSGCTAAGKVFTSARILRPAVDSDVKADTATVKVSGVIPADQLAQGKVLEGRIDYTRTFRLNRNALHVQTVVKADGKDKIAELYETLPVFHREGNGQQGKDLATKIEFEVGGKWVPATPEFQAGVTAIQLTRFKGAVRITFDQSRRVKLAPAEWKGEFITRAGCRTILIDLLPPDARSVGYSIAPVKP